ncbi:hypothetical protein DEAC_c28290 [Desulfosporosinus acididurans]|uniref:DUF2127 domain-containing protein n=1 Tax=Desulfosporosinus acididurans TaxID=476652 RepID=A0A0J1FPM6_9FIRM|nr:DUF2127 domain-containing protein [Desulfosporosinus acididurans]KLU65277.1 hypothetical protein DEAC_c28290 [Desulfosporosinus acididurans]
MGKFRNIDISNIFHKSFKIGLSLKAIDGFLEMIGGILLLFLNPARLNKMTVMLTEHELSQDPTDIIANTIIKMSSKFTVNTQYFGVIYLISHGALKLILVIVLWKRKVWAYPLTIISLGIFVVYQIYRYTIYHSTVLLLLTFLDIIIIALTYIEYKKLKTKSHYV